MIKAILFDFIGTVVKEKGGEVINTCFEKAFSDNNVKIDTALLNNQRGKDKKVIIQHILGTLQFPVSLTEDIYLSFVNNLELQITAFSENDGALALFSYLLKRNIYVGLGTGLERIILHKIFKHLSWNTSYFDYIGIANETGRSRPYPDMIFDMMKKLKITNTNEVLKVGDTMADIQEGKNANVLTAAILSGTQPKESLLRESPDYVLHSLSDIIKIVESFY